MDSILHIIGLSFIPIMTYIVIIGMKDILSLLKEEIHRYKIKKISRKDSPQKRRISFRPFYDRLFLNPHLSKDYSLESNTSSS